MSVIISISTTLICNTDIPCAGGGLIWFADEQDAMPLNGGSITNFYVVQSPQPPYSTWPWYQQCVWPCDSAGVIDGVQPCLGWGTIIDPGGTSSHFEPADNITGTITLGRPAGGSYVLAADVGMNYVSPWDSVTSTVIDSNPTRDMWNTLGPTGGIGQSFTGNGMPLNQVQVYMDRTGSSVGDFDVSSIR